KVLERELKGAKPTILQLVDFAKSLEWESPEPKASARDARPQAQPVASSLRCQLHGVGTHATKDCRALRASNNSARPGATDGQAASATTPAAGADSASAKKPPAGSKNAVRRAVVVPHGNDKANRRMSEEPLLGPSTFVTLRCNGQEHAALLDSG